MSDQFGATTQQDLYTGGDGAKSYGWNLLNSAHATGADVNITNPGYLSIYPTGVSYPTGATFTVPFVYKNLSGDFDVNIGTNATNYPFGFIVRDPDASSGEDWLGLSNIPGDMAYSKNTTNSSTTQYGANTLFKYFRIARSGAIFTTYLSTDGSSWSQHEQFTRNDFASSVQVGIYAYGATAVDYFDEITPSVTASAAITLPVTTISASIVSVGTVGATMTLPHLMDAGACSQTGNFCNNQLPVFTLDGEFAAQADVTFDVPVVTIDGSASGSITSFGRLSVLSLRINGGVTTGTGGYGKAVLPIFTAKSQMAATSALALPCFKTDTEYLTGRIAGTRVLRIPRFRIDTLAYNPPIINVSANSPVLKLSAGMLTGGGCQCDVRVSALKMPSLPFVNAYAGGVSAMAAATPAVVVSMSGHGQYKGNGAVAIPLFALESIGVGTMMGIVRGNDSRVIVLNINTGTLTEYTAYDFNGFCQWGEDYFAGGDGGIYILEGDTDDGVPISCSIKTSKTELKNARGRDESSIKRVPEVYTVVRTPSPFVFKAMTDDGAENVYLSEVTDPSMSDRTAPRRIKLGKGMRGRYWQFAIENTGGAALEIESFEPEVAAIGRRV
ncbi:MAG: hypothetical protein HQK95_05785 [Nitrospirae bacterium]|nr:hypothetical protein [Nitrospirota bacterium]